VFGLLIVEELPVDDPRVETVLSTIVLTVLLSVIAHGISGRPFSAWFGRQEPTPEGSTGDEVAILSRSPGGRPDES
jgi:NhaP-type Na+/H+ or K+/H+ antiporter